MKHSELSPGTIAIPGIKRLFTVDGRKLQPGIMYQSMVGLDIAINADLHPVEISGLPTLEVEIKLINGGFIEKTTLNFISPRNKPVLFPLTCWIAQTVDGRNFLIGNRETKAPVPSFRRSFGSLDSQAGYIVTVTHLGRASISEVIL